MTRLLICLLLVALGPLAGAQTRSYPTPVGQDDPPTSTIEAPGADSDADLPRETGPRTIQKETPQETPQKTLQRGQQTTPRAGAGAGSGAPGPQGVAGTGGTVAPGAPPDPADAAAVVPVVRLALEADSSVPGQPVRLRLKVLVPSFMPAPPVLPSYDLPNLMVRLPAKSTLPTSETVGGDTWNGITRSYLLIPLVAGAIRLPPQPVIVTHAAPDTGQPVVSELMTGELTLTGTVPEGAEALDPFIAADALSLAQTVEGLEPPLEAGDAVTRRLTVTVEGTVPMVVPALLGTDAPVGLSAYPEDPSVETTTDRGVIGGIRTEAVTYVAEAGGGFELPAVSMAWFDLQSGQVVTATADAISFAVSGAPAETPLGSEARDRRLWRLAPVLLVCLLGSFAYLRYGPRVRAWRAARQAAWEASEEGAWTALDTCIRARDFPGTFAAFDVWRRHRPTSPRALPDTVTGALADLG
ncbi:MAG: hypothetical protein AAF501_12800, partial [Pseudomonadota bacterium]